jgi:hypothetical protein
VEEVFGFADELTRLTRGRRSDDGERSGMMAGLVNRAGRDSGGLAPLPASVEETAADERIEGYGLVGIGVEVETIASEGCGVYAFARGDRLLDRLPLSAIPLAHGLSFAYGFFAAAGAWP